MGTSFTAVTVTVNTSSTVNAPTSVARTVIVAVPLASAMKLRSRALSAAPMVGVTRPALVLLWIMKVRAEPSSTSVNTAFKSR